MADKLVMPPRLNENLAAFSNQKTAAMVEQLEMRLLAKRVELRDLTTMGGAVITSVKEIVILNDLNLKSEDGLVVDSVICLPKKATAC